MNLNVGAGIHHTIFRPRRARETRFSEFLGGPGAWQHRFTMLGNASDVSRAVGTYIRLRPRYRFIVC